MKWLTLDAIKKHSRIDYDCEDSLLEMYGESAEETVLNIINRSYEEVVSFTEPKTALFQPPSFTPRYYS